MKKVFLALCLLIPSLALAQGSFVSFAVQSPIGNSIAGANIALCSSLPTQVTPCGASSLQQTYADITLGTACTLNPTIPGPLYGIGCTNPGVTDGQGMAHIYAAASTSIFYYQAYASGIPVTRIEPLLFPVSTEASLPNPAVFPGPVTVSGPTTLSTLFASNPGIFSSTQQSEYVQSILNGCSPATEWHATQGTFATDAIAGCVASPSTAPGQANAVAGYASGNPGASIVGGFFQGRCLANGCNGWGQNAVAQDVIGLTSGVSLYGNDTNLNPQNAPSAYVILSGYNTALDSRLSGIFGNGYTCQVFGGSPGTWGSCYSSADQATTVGFSAGSQPGTAPQPSQLIALFHRDSGGVTHLSNVFSDTAGNLNLNAFSGNLAVPHNGANPAVLQFSGNTTSRTYGFPDTSGTVCLTSTCGAGGSALKYATADAHIFASTAGNDANDGLSAGTAKATISGATTACGSASFCIIEVSAGGLALPSSITFTNAVTLQCDQRATITYSSNSNQLIFNGQGSSVLGCGFSGQGSGVAGNPPIVSSKSFFVFDHNSVSSFGSTGGLGILSITGGFNLSVTNNIFNQNGDVDVVVTNATASQIMYSLLISNNIASDVAISNTGAGATLAVVQLLGNDLSAGEASKANPCIKTSSTGPNISDLTVNNNVCVISAGVPPSGYDIGEASVLEFDANSFDASGLSSSSLLQAAKFTNITGYDISNNQFNNSGFGSGVLSERLNNGKFAGNTVYGLSSSGNGLVFQVTAASGTFAGNKVSGNTAILPNGSTGVGISQICNATSAVCSNNTYSDNSVFNGTAGIKLLNTTGTSSGNGIGVNYLNTITTAISVGSGVSGTQVAPQQMIGVTTALSDSGSTTSSMSAPTSGGGALVFPGGSGTLCTVATCTLGSTGIQFVPAGSNTAAIQAILNAATAGQEVDFTGTYTACGLTLTTANVRLRGLSTDGAVIQCATANSPVLTVSGAADEVVGLKLTHITNSPTCPGGNGTSTCGDGLQIAGGATRVKIENVHTNFNYNGMALGYTTYSELSNSVTEFNNNHGVDFVMDATHKNMQWQVSRVLSEQNLGNGFDMTCPNSFTNVQTPGPYITGWTATFGNAGYGFNFSCSGATTSGIADVWLDGVFASQNNASGFHFDMGPNGGRNVIANAIYSEQAGTYPGTAGFASATQTPSNVGSGIEITSSCDPTFPPVITGGGVWGNSLAGVLASCPGTSIANLDSTNNGAAAASAQTESGIEINATDVSVNGGYHRKASNQTYGIYVLSGDTPHVVNPVCDSGIGTTNCVFAGTPPTNGFQQRIGQAILGTSGSSNGFTANGFLCGGTTFTSSGGLNDTALTGGATCGKLTTATVTTGSTVVTMGSSATAPHGWACSALDITHPADVIVALPTSATTITLTIVSSITAGDVIQFGPCEGY